MTLIAFGINHRSAPLDVLERVSLAGDRLPKALAGFVQGDHVNEVVVLSTCNRVEVFAHVERFHDGYANLRDAMSTATDVGIDEFVPYVYVYDNEAATRHLFKVAAGLDSAVLGEHEILGQLKVAWETARIEGACQRLLDPLFEHAIRSGKRVRTETVIGRRTASLSHSAVSLVREQLGDLDGKRVLLVGAGEVGAGVAQALHRTAEIDIVVSNRTASRADEVAAALGARTVPFDGFADELANVDVLISSTGATNRVLHHESVERAMTNREAPMLVLDLAVPRDVDPSVSEIDGVTMLVLGDLQAFANRGLVERQKAVADAELVVDEEIAGLGQRLSAQEVSPLLGSMYRWADAVRIDEIDKQAARFADLDPESRAAAEALTKAVVAKILHEPAARLRDAAGTTRGDRLAESLRDLFDLQ